MFQLSAPIVATFVLYVLALIGTGIRAYSRTHTFDDFALGGRRFGPYVAALSAGASDMSGWLFLALPGAVYAAGLGSVWIAFGLAVGTYLNWLFVAPRLRTYTERAGNAVTLSGYLEERFEDRTRTLRLVSAAVTLVFFTVYVGSGLVAGGLLFQTVFDLRFTVGVTLTGLLIVIYSCLGGFLAVSLTHVLQASLMLLGLIVLPAVAIARLGGFGALGDALDGRQPALREFGSRVDFGGGVWTGGGPLGAVAIVSLLAWGLGYFGQPHILARFMSIRSTEDVPAARRIGTVWVVLVLTGATLVGLAGIGELSPTLSAPDTVYIALSRALLDPWIAGVVLAAVLAAVVSTADSQLMVSSVALTEDFYRAFLNRHASDRALVWVGRGTVVLVIVVAYVIALHGGGLLNIVAYAWAGFGAAFGPVVLLSLYWPRMTSAGAMAGIVAGAGTVLLWDQVNPLLGPLESGVYEMVPGVLVATVAALVFGRYVGRPPKRAFWRMPGGGTSQVVLTPFLTRAPVGLAMLDTDLRYVWVNEPLDRLIPLERRLGRRLSELRPTSEFRGFEEQMRRVLETGEPVMDWEFRSAEEDPREARAVSVSFFGVTDRRDRPVGVLYMVVDVTERWHAQNRLALLNDAGARIGSTLDVPRTAQELADEAVPSLADFVAVDLLDSVMRGEEPAPGPVGLAPVIRRAGQASAREGGCGGSLALGEAVRRAPSSPVTRCLLESRTLVERDLDRAASPWVTEDPSLGASILTYDYRSLMVVPVRARGVTLGVATFARTERFGPFEDDDVRLAEEFVSRAAVAVDNARRYTRERTAARAMQQALLPQALSGGSALDVASWYQPADVPNGVGGDWFDVIPLSGARVALVVGDVVGHGMEAAATMGRLRTAVRTLANLDLPPDELLARLDDLVIGLMGAHDDHEPAAAGSAFLGATCLYAVYDPVGGRCAMARAGHLPPVLVTPDGTAEVLDLPAGPPLGLGYLPFEACERDFAEGSLLAFYTDGLVETPDRDIDDGIARLGDALAVPRSSLREIGRGVVETLLTGPPPDDAALLLARTRRLPADRIASWDLPSDPAAVGTARTAAVRQLSEWGLDELAFTTELVVSELVTNAIRHASGPVALRLIRDRGLICEVTDGSGTSPRPRHARTTDEGGRGLMIVAQLAHRWGTRHTATGKVIWTEQPFVTEP
ncbi:sodium/proline symporter [Streptomyces sp. T12]|uniref:sodium/proline symporter PutP n=1 Tax=Streptomyces sp. T12 TaxID=477697 RepID=UPI0011A7B051|nr:sodium/proline symporter PutP [Streptomyces sp. T12]TWD25327.1 sodium/proline symporter [Streptomyces sp. T12]